MMNVTIDPDTCPVCGEEQRETGICPECGYDPGKQYEIYPTLGQIRSDAMPVSAWRKNDASFGKMVLDREITRIEAEISRTEAELARMKEQLEALKGRREATGKAEAAKRVQIGDILTLGTYAQDKNGIVLSPIEWIVLDKDEEKGRALILSRYGMDAKPYNGEWKSVTWETCDLRKWLNGDFLANSFDEKEKGRILESVVKADKNPKYDTDPGRDTKDRVFLLSVPEAERYLETEEKRQCQPTERAVADGAYSDGGNCLWWLRSPGDRGHDAASVDCGGAVVHDYVYYGSRCARPALWINL